MSIIEQLLDKFKDQVVRLPSLYSLSPSWHPRVVPDLDGKLEENLELWRQRWLLEPTAYKRNLATDCGYFTRAASPDASLPNLQIGARFTSWLFAWDDALDIGSFSVGPRQRELIRIEMSRTIQRGLLGKTDIEQPPDWKDVPVTLAESFYDIGFPLQEGTELEPLQDFFCNELCKYVTRVVNFEDAFQNGIIMNLDVYLKDRMEGSGVYAVIGQALILQDIALPAWFINHTVPMEMMRHINIMVSLSNDIVSARNELRCKHVDNIIPLLVYHQGLGPQEATDYACQLINDSYTAFESLVPDVLALASKSGLADKGPMFVTCCKNVDIGLVNWLYHIKRYHDFRPEADETESFIAMG